MEKYLAAIDVGTTNLKTVIVDTAGNLVSKASREFSNIYNRLGPGWVEQDAGMWWQAACQTSRQALQTAGINPTQIAGIGLTSIRQTIIPVDKNGDPVRNAILWSVKATYPQADWIRENIGPDEVYRITGNTIDPLWGTPSIMHVIQNEPEVNARTFKFAHVEDFILHKLGADDFCESYSMAGCSLIFDLEKLQWNQDLCSRMGIPVEQLPRAVPSGTVVGRVCPKAAEATGFAEGTALVTGGGDIQCGTVGAGVIEAGEAFIVVGTALNTEVCLDKPLFDPEKRALVHPHSEPGKYVMESTLLTGANAYTWFRDTFCPVESDAAKKLNISPYELINSQVTSVPIGANGLIFIPHFVGATCPYWDDTARGVFLGATLATTKADFARAIVEGACLEMRKSLDIVQSLGAAVDQIRLSGGACTEGSPWNRIQADIYGKPVALLKVGETTALGAAMLAGVGAGLFKDVPQAVAQMVKVVKTIEPNMEAHRKYEGLLEIHDAAYRALSAGGVYKKLRTVTAELS
ncbi:MAG: FGGY family carbohydrate kinase [Planctomycetota bacterium]|nr:FGGY family carbohydrate kinase [Planctomycetota bacterium]